jgi:hypothetical protein
MSLYVAVHRAGGLYHMIMYGDYRGVGLGTVISIGKGLSYRHRRLVSIYCMSAVETVGFQVSLELKSWYSDVTVL